jgi:hypothetical protein
MQLASLEAECPSESQVGRPDRVACNPEASAHDRLNPMIERDS